MTTKERIVSTQAAIKWRCEVLLARIDAGDMDLFVRDWRIASIGTYVAALCKLGGMHDIKQPAPRRLARITRRPSPSNEHCEHCEC